MQTHQGVRHSLQDIKISLNEHGSFPGAPGMDCWWPLLGFVCKKSIVIQAPSTDRPKLEALLNWHYNHQLLLVTAGIKHYHLELSFFFPNWQALKHIAITLHSEKKGCHFLKSFKGSLQGKAGCGLSFCGYRTEYFFSHSFCCDCLWKNTGDPSVWTGASSSCLFPTDNHFTPSSLPTCLTEKQ